MKSRWIVGLLTVLSFALSAAFVAGPAVAEDKKKDAKPAPDAKAKEEVKTPEITDAIKALGNLHAAYVLVEYGRKEKAPEALLTAARIIGTTPIQKAGEFVKDEKEKGTEPVEPQKQAEELIIEALKLAKDLPEKERASLEGLAAATRSHVEDRKRAVVGGPRFFNSSKFTPGQTKTQTFDLIGGSTSISVISLTGGSFSISVQGALTGLDYGTYYGSPHAYATIGHLPFAKLTFKVTNRSYSNATANIKIQ